MRRRSGHQSGHLPSRHAHAKKGGMGVSLGEGGPQVGLMKIRLGSGGKLLVVKDLHGAVSKTERCWLTQILTVLNVLITNKQLHQACMI